MATKLSPSYEGIKQFGRVLLVGTVSSVLVSLISIFSLEPVEFMDAVKNPFTWYGLLQMIGLFFMKDLLQSLGLGVDKGVHIEGKNTGNENLEKGLTRF